MSQVEKKRIVVSFIGPSDENEELGSALKESGATVDCHQGSITKAAGGLMNGHAPDILLVELNPDDQDELAALTKYTQEMAGRTKVFATVRDASVEHVRRIMRTGVFDFLPHPIKCADVLAAIHRTEGVAPAVARETPLPGRVISFLRCAGGVGATTLAVEAACELQARLLQGSRKACYLDLDLQFGNAALMLDLEASATILNVVEHADGLDHTLLDKLFGHHRTGLDLLAAPRQVVPLDALTPAITHKILYAARQSHEVVFVDLPLAWSDWSLSVVKQSDVTIIVTGLSVPDLDRTNRLLTALREQSLAGGELILVATRTPRFWSGERRNHAEKALGRKIDFCIVKDEDTVTEAHDRGVLFSDVRRGSRIQKDVHAFASSLASRLAALSKNTVSRPILYR